jgi:hypothetical protein
MRLFLLAVSLTFGAGIPQPASAPETPAFERFAGEIVVFGPSDFVYGFRRSWIPHDSFLPIERFSQFLAGRQLRSEDLLPLLDHRDPKVRTLALIALYNLEDPALLPRIFALVDDRASTFPAMLPHAGPFPIEITPRMLSQQTVGDFATAIVNTYMKSGGYFYGPHGMRSQPGFQQYWKARAARTSTAGWWSIRLARAGHGTMPTPKESYAAIKRLRAQIDMLPQPERTYVLLWLHRDAGSDVLVTADELLSLCQKLGPDALLDLLSRKIRSDDPDLQPRSNNNYGYARMSVFVLRHAKTLLRPADADALLDRETWERDYQKHGITDPLISPWWAIAAAQFDDRAAPSILRSAYARFQDEYQGYDRLELAEAIWRQNGDASTAVDWFYRELADPNTQESYYLNKLLNTDVRSGEPLAKALVEDARFDELNWKSLETLARTLNAWKRREVISEEELRSAWSPMGTDFYFKDRAKALEEYPKETAEMLARLARWREVLRRAVTSP